MRCVLLGPSNKLDVFWLDDTFAMNHYTFDAINHNRTFLPEHLGGIFTSPPAAVASGENRIDVFGLGLDYNVYHKVFDGTASDGGAWSAAWESLGGNFTSTPVVLPAANGGIDLFGLANDQGMVHRRWNGRAWSDWERLGGGFTSLPVILPAATGSFDIFARGLDFMLYYSNWKPGGKADWGLLGGGLLGEPTAASAPAAVRVRDATFVFVAGSDGAIWYTAFDGKIWRPWISMGPAFQVPPDPDTVNLQPPGPSSTITFTTEPVAIAFFSHEVPPDGSVFDGGASDIASSQPNIALPPQARVDVFAVGSDSALWHRWLDNKGWHGETNANGETGNWQAIISKSQSTPNLSLTRSSLACAPSIAASNLGRTVTSMPPIALRMVEPSPDGTIHLLSWDGTTWFSWDVGPHFRLPSYYTFSVDSVQIDAIRSNENLFQKDTDLATATLAVGRWPILPVSFNLGDVSSGGYALYNMTFAPQVVELCEPVVFTYAIVNSGKKGISDFLISMLIKFGEDFATNQVGSLVGQKPQTILVDLGLLTDTTLVTAVGGAGVMSAAAAAGLKAGLDALIGLAYADCDGIVAAEPRTFRRGRDLQQLINTFGQQGKYVHSTRHLGSDSAAGCGGNSSYQVFWSITE